MTSIMWPTRSRTSQPSHRVMTFQFFGSETSLVKFSRSRRITVITVDLAPPSNGLTGVITAVLISSSLNHWLMSAGRRRGRDDDWRQDLVQALPADLEPRRKTQRGAQILGRLVDGESRPIGRDLEKHSARLAEVDRLEVPTVDRGRHVATGGREVAAPPLLRLGVRRSPGDVVDGARRFAALGSFRRLDHVEGCVRTAVAGLESRPVALLGRNPESHH